MKLKCPCGSVLTNISSPNETENYLVSDRSKERLQNLVDAEVAEDGIVDLWPEHWELCEAVEIWKCAKCQRLLVNPSGPKEQVVVYNIEKVGIN